MSLDSQPVSSFQSIPVAPLTPLTKDQISQVKGGTGKLTFSDNTTRDVKILLTKQDLAQFGGFFTSNATCIKRFAEALSADFRNQRTNEPFLIPPVGNETINLTQYTFLDAKGQEITMSDKDALSRIATVTSRAFPAIHKEQLNADSAMDLIKQLNMKGSGTDHKLVMQKDGFFHIQTRTSTKEIHKSTNTVKAFNELLNVAKNEKDPIKKLQLLTALDDSTWAKNVCKGNVSCDTELKTELNKANKSFEDGSTIKTYNEQIKQLSEKDSDKITKEEIMALSNQITFLATKGKTLNFILLINRLDFEGVDFPEDIKTQLDTLVTKQEKLIKQVFEAKEAAAAAEAAMITEAWKALEVKTKVDTDIGKIGKGVPSGDTNFKGTKACFDGHDMKTLFSKTSRFQVFASARGLVESKEFFNSLLESSEKSIAVINLRAYKAEGEKDYPAKSEYPKFNVNVQTKIEEDSDATFKKHVRTVTGTSGEKTIDAYQVSLWPDHGVVSTSVLDKYVNKLLTLRQSQTVVVHCTAGVGRTGTLLVAAALKESFQKGEITKANLMKKISDITYQARIARNSDLTVQDPSQFELLYQYGKSLLASI